MALVNDQNVIVEDADYRHKILAGDLSLMPRLMDATLLRVDATEKEILALVDAAKNYKARSVCVAPHFVPLVVEKLKNQKDVKSCTVIGFPNGYSSLESKCFEIKELLQWGCDEFDFVQNGGLVKEEKWDEIKTQFCALKNAANDKIIKVILETALLSQKEIFKTTLLACEAGLSYVKTSTGFSTRGASREDIETMQAAINEYQKKHPRKYVGIKASGGIKTQTQALEMIKAGATRIGASQIAALLK